MADDGRSPIRPRQLHDLRLAPTATDPRPMFVWSAESPRDGETYKTFPYPKLLWHGETGQEITVTTSEEERAKLDAGYVTMAPFQRVLDPVADLSEALASLTPEEQALILDAQAQDRRNKLQAKIAQLSESDLERLLAQSTEPAKKRGRPAKVA